MTTFQHSVVIERPLEEVWEYTIDPANDPVWQSMVTEVRSGGGEPLRVGSRIEEVFHFLGRRFDITFEVTEHEPMSRSAVKASSAPVPMEGSYEYERVDGGTRFSTIGETNAHGLFRLAEPVFARMAGRAWATSCATLKDVLESRNGS